MSKGFYVTAVVSTGVLAGAYWTYCFYNKSKQRKIPTIWKEVGYLKNILIYPIKSCSPVHINKAECTLLGLRDGWLRDRHMLIVDDKYNFITARAVPKVLLIQSAVENSILTLSNDEMEPLKVDLAEIVSLQEPVEATVWGAKVPVYDCGWEASEWLSRLLIQYEKIFKLVLSASNPNRYSTSFFRNKSATAESGIYADEASFNLINESSIKDLNERLNGKKVSYKHFRSNFILSGAKAYEEDDWAFIKIGENIFEIVKPCTRCIMTTFDPETGIRNQSAEPLATLRSYRQITEPQERKYSGSSPRMGIQMKLRSGEGKFLSVNDKIYAAS